MSSLPPAGATPVAPQPDLHSAAAIRQGFLAAAVVVVCWSGFNIVSRLGGRSPLTPWDQAALRFAVAAVVLLPLFVQSLRRDSAVLRWRQRLALALAGGLAYALCAYSGFARAPAAHAGVLVNGGIPVATTLLGWQLFGLHPTRRAWWALLVALLGIVLIGHHGLQLGSGGSVLAGDACFLAAAVSWGFYGQLVRRWQVPPRSAASSIAVVSAVLYLPVYALCLPKGLAQASATQIALQAGYQGIVAGVVAASFYSYATLRIGPTRASLMLALVPPISAVLAVPLLGEALTLETGLGALLVSAGALLGSTGGSGIRIRSNPPP